jgi:monoamine oxidase
MPKRVVIIGAGAAGLAAAGELSKAGVQPLILEARARCGGRIHTLRQLDQAPIELGAEFIHGKPPAVEQLAREHHLAKREASDKHWRIDRGKFHSLGNLWEQLSEVFEEIPEKGPDKSYCEFLKGVEAGSQPRALATDFVEGFHAADPHRISLQSISISDEASEEIDGTKQFRFVAGYWELIRAMEAKVLAGGGQILFDHAASRIDWKPKHVVVHAKNESDVHRFEAEALIVTLPLGVLQSGAVQFDPPLTEKEAAICALAMGNVVRLNLQLRAGLWPDDNEGFIHLASDHFPTWWKHRDVVTAWAGGPKADQLAKGSSVEVIDVAIKSLADMFGVKHEEARGFIVSAQFHDWRNDPFARGAYSYVPVGALEAQKAIARPVKRTLFFAGEATAREGLQGTVHGAVESGIRAAREVAPKFCWTSGRSRTGFLRQ